MKTFRNGVEKKKVRKLKVKNFRSTIDDMYDYIKPLLKKCPDHIILHFGTNNTVNESSKVLLSKLLDLLKILYRKVALSSLI